MAAAIKMKEKLRMEKKRMDSLAPGGPFGANEIVSIRRSQGKAERIRGKCLDGKKKIMARLNTRVLREGAFARIEVVPRFTIDLAAEESERLRCLKFGTL
jgi:hypothetical protein